MSVPRIGQASSQGLHSLQICLQMEVYKVKTIRRVDNISILSLELARSTGGPGQKVRRLCSAPLFQLS